MVWHRMVWKKVKLSKREKKKTKLLVILFTISHNNREKQDISLTKTKRMKLIENKKIFLFLSFSFVIFFDFSHNGIFDNLWQPVFCFFLPYTERTRVKGSYSSISFYKKNVLLLTPTNRHGIKRNKEKKVENLLSKIDLFECS